MSTKILGIETSCDDTSAAIIEDGKLLSNVISSQKVHQIYGGVVPELASRAHQQNILPVVDLALKEAGVEKHDLDGVAFTRGPGLMGSLLVGASFAKGFALASDVNLIDINHLQAHILVHFIREKGIDYKPPSFPFLCLLASGGHTQLVVVKDHLHHEIIGRTIDDAAGEAFDKCAKVMGLPYPGGPLIDKLAKEGNPDAYHFSKPRIPGYDYSYSGLKTSFLYFLRDRLKENENFVSLNKVDLCASLQKAIVDVLMEKLLIASKETGIREIALAGGVSANAGLRTRVQEESARQNWKTYIPPVKFTTDNAAMIAINGYYKFLKGEFAGMSVSPSARVDF